MRNPKIAAVCLISLLGVAHANTDALQVAENEGEASAAFWHIHAGVYGFAPKTKGDMGLGAYHVSPNISFSEAWDDLDQAYMAYVDVRRERFGAYVDQQYIKTQSHERAHVPVAPNVKVPVDAQLKSTLNRTSVGLYYQALNHPIGHQQRLILEPTVGVHFTRVSGSLDVSAAPLLGAAQAHVKRTASWREPYVGARVKWDLNAAWNVSGQVDVGSKNSKGYQGYVGYRTKLLKTPIHMRAGYRVIDQNHAKNGFDWHIKQSGPVLGLGFQFK